MHKSPIPCWRDWKSCKDWKLLFTTSRGLTAKEQEALFTELHAVLVKFSKDVEGELYIQST